MQNIKKHYWIINRLVFQYGHVLNLLLQANVVGSALYATGAAEGMVSNFGPKGILVKNILPDGKWWLFLYEWTFNICNIVVGIVGAGSANLKINFIGQKFDI